MSYYHNFKIILGNPLWRIYLRWRYQKSIEDFEKLDFKPNFSKKDFTALLCGVGNETTADEFIKFVIDKNQNSNIWIIDLGEEQIKAIKNLVNKKYQNFNIKIEQINALNLRNIIKPKTVNWIETDGLFEFLDNENIQKLLFIWKELLVDDGFITTTATSSRWRLQEYFDQFKIWIGKIWLGVKVYAHTRNQMRGNLKIAGFDYVEGRTFIPYFKRYSLIKQVKTI